MKAAPFGSEEREKMLREFLNYSRRRLTEDKLEEAVRNLQTADNEKLARKLFDVRYTGVTLQTLANKLGLPVRKVQSGLTTLRNNGFVWYAHEEGAKVYRYFLLDIKL